MSRTSVAGVAAAHIHKGARERNNGNIVVPLIEGAKSGSKFTGCVKNVKKSLISAITKHPKKYYVNESTRATSLRARSAGSSTSIVS